MRVAHLTLLTLVLPCLACESEEDEPKGFSIVTYNAGLADGFVPYARERAPLIEDALADLRTDVMCVQEVWTQADWDGLAMAAAGSFPHTYRRDPEPSANSTCEEGELDDIEACINDLCGDEPVDKLATCALDNCKDEVGNLGATCLNCLISQLGNTIEDVKATCESGGEGSSYAYEGSFGTGILSNLPLDDTDSLLLPSTANRRAVLYASFEEPTLGKVHFFCTHLTANLSAVPYTGSFGSWELEQKKQVQIMLDFIEQKAGETGTVILAGDLNSGPAAEGFLAELPENYALYAEAGLRDPYADEGKPLCTYCDENLLNSDLAAGEGGLIDHVMLPETLEGTAERLLTGTVDITFEGEPLTTSYSDHYGIRMVVTRR
ncbi:MAG: endonuclease/exonuclease/phosphatase family protein [Myxococcales bacterium]|nr:endonuclease/exonuclease/phosphatase family protein [Myxococcales bacterium]